MTEIKEYISKDYLPIDCKSTIRETVLFLGNQKFSHFPVLDNNIFIGNLPKEDLEFLDIENKITDCVSVLLPFFVTDKMSWFEILENFSKNDTNLLPVINLNGDYLGYYERDLVFDIFCETTFMQETAKILIIQKNISSYSMSQIVQIVETNNGKLLGLFLSKIEDNLAQIVLKISSESINSTIQDFRRYEYEIMTSHQDDDYIQEIKENSIYLERYLSI